MNKTELLLKQIEAYLSLMRYKYTSQEQLYRLNILHDYYISENKKFSKEKLSSTFETAESLGKDLILPLKVRGIFLTEGRPLKKYYTSEELKKAAENPINQKFPLMLDHKDNEAGKVIGMVDKIIYDPKIKGLRWWGHINDETFARNVLDGIINSVSATIYSVTDYDEEYGIVGKDLTFKELSLVMKGAEPSNSIEPY